MSFTASSYERVLHCPASAALPQVQTSNQWTEEGNEGHRVICDFVKGMPGSETDGSVPVRWVDAVAALVPWAKSLIPEAAFKVNLGTWQAYFLGSDIGRRYNLEPGEVAGTADLAGKLSPTEVLIIDTKTGWGSITPPADNRQLRILAAMAARAWGCKTAKVALLRCPEGVEPSWQWAELDQMDLDFTMDEAKSVYFRVEIERNKGSIVPVSVSEGSWCRHCPAYVHCPAKTSLVKRLANGSELDELELMKPLDARTAGLAWTRIGETRKLLARVESACHAALEQFGELELPNGKRLRKVIDDGNEKIDGDEAFELLCEKFGTSVATAAVSNTMTKKALGVALRERFGRGGAAKEREVLGEMRERGIITRGKVEKLVEFDE